MIGFPRVMNLAEQIRKTLTGKRISDVSANRSPHAFAWYSGDPTDYPAMLRGKTVSGAHVFSGSAWIEADDMRLQISTLSSTMPQAKASCKTPAFVQFEDGSAISCTVQIDACSAIQRAGNLRGFPLHALPTPARRPRGRV